MPPEKIPKFLIIRRDNIGDLACTTPVFRALRERYPDAYICALVNSYNLSVLDNNPDIDQAFAYTKAKHRPPGKTIFGVYLDRLQLIWRLRRIHFDYVVLAGPGFQGRSLSFARMLAPKHIVGFVLPNGRKVEHIDISVPYQPVPTPVHEVEDTFRLLSTLGITSSPPTLQVIADPLKTAGVARLIKQKRWTPNAPLLGIHISARKPSQRWPSSHFIALIQKLHQARHANFILLWSPGDDKNPLHPGDDAKAKEIISALPNIPVLAYPTYELGQLIAALSLCHTVICSDGGAMHLAAGLGKPILCFFGKSESSRWHPWRVPYVLLQPDSFDVKDVTIEETFDGVTKLLDQTNY